MIHISSDILNNMAEEASRELNSMLHPSARAKAKNMAKSLIGRGSASISDPIFWPAGLLLTGLVEAGRTEDAEAYLAQWQRQGSPVRNPDDALTGAVILSLYEQTGKEIYRSAADKIYTYLKGCLRDENGSIIYGQQSGNSWIYADGTGMTALFLTRYAAMLRASRKDDAVPAACTGGTDSPAAACRPDTSGDNLMGDDLPGNGLAGDGLPGNGLVGDGLPGNRLAGDGSVDDGLLRTARDARSAEDTGREEGCAPEEGADPRQPMDPMDDARLQLLNYIQYGMDVRSGLPYHGYDAENRLKLGIIGWGRAVGWLLLGMSEYLIRNPGDEVISASAGRICTAVIGRIREDGMLSWQLDCTEGPRDTSATGMIFYSLLRMKRFCAAHPDTAPASFPEIDDHIVDAAAAGLYECVSENGKVYWSSAECVDFAQYRQQYGHYPWGQGAALALMSLYENP